MSANGGKRPRRGVKKPVQASGTGKSPSKAVTAMVVPLAESNDDHTCPDAGLAGAAVRASATAKRQRSSEASSTTGREKAQRIDALHGCTGSSSHPKAEPGHPCFTATGMEISTRQKRMLTDLGITLAIDWQPLVTHLIADTFRRTNKMMCAICRGALVLVPDYLSACRTAGRLVDEAPFALRDSVCEAAFARKRTLTGGYSLQAALEKARQNGPLLQGMSVYCFPSITENHAEKRALQLLVSAAGGVWLSRFPAAPNDSTVLLLAARTVISDCEEQRRKSHAVYDVELLREAACTQEIRRSTYRLR